MWFERINSFLKGLGFETIGADSNVYINTHNSHTLYIGLYIDDCIIMSNNLEYLNNTKQTFFQEFDMTDLGDIQYCLEIQILRNREKGIIHLSQGKYIRQWHT